MALLHSGSSTVAKANQTCHPSSPPCFSVPFCPRGMMRHSAPWCIFRENLRLLQSELPLFTQLPRRGLLGNSRILKAEEKLRVLNLDFSIDRSGFSVRGF